MRPSTLQLNNTQPLPQDQIASPDLGVFASPVNVTNQGVDAGSDWKGLAAGLEAIKAPVAQVAAQDHQKWEEQTKLKGVAKGSELAASDSWRSIPEFTAEDSQVYKDAVMASWAHTAIGREMDNAESTIDQKIKTGEIQTMDRATYQKGVNSLIDAIKATNDPAVQAAAFPILATRVKKLDDKIADGKAKWKVKVDWENYNDSTASDLYDKPLTATTYADIKNKAASLNIDPVKMHEPIIGRLKTLAQAGDDNGVQQLLQSKDSKGRTLKQNLERFEDGVKAINEVSKTLDTTLEARRNNEEKAIAKAQKELEDSMHEDLNRAIDGNDPVSLQVADGKYRSDPRLARQYLQWRVNNESKLVKMQAQSSIAENYADRGVLGLEHDVLAHPENKEHIEKYLNDSIYVKNDVLTQQSSALIQLNEKDPKKREALNNKVIQDHLGQQLKLLSPLASGTGLFKVPKLAQDVGIITRGNLTDSSGNVTSPETYLAVHSTLGLMKSREGRTLVRQHAPNEETYVLWTRLSDLHEKGGKTVEEVLNDFQTGLNKGVDMNEVAKRTDTYMSSKFDGAWLFFNRHDKFSRADSTGWPLDADIANMKHVKEEFKPKVYAAYMADPNVSDDQLTETVYDLGRDSIITSSKQKPSSGFMSLVPSWLQRGFSYAIVIPPDKQRELGISPEDQREFIDTLNAAAQHRDMVDSSKSEPDLRVHVEYNSQSGTFPVVGSTHKYNDLSFDTVKKGWGNHKTQKADAAAGISLSGNGKPILEDYRQTGASAYTPVGAMTNGMINLAQSVGQKTFGTPKGRAEGVNYFKDAQQVVLTNSTQLKRQVENSAASLPITPSVTTDPTKMRVDLGNSQSNVRKVGLVEESYRSGDMSRALGTALFGFQPKAANGYIGLGFDLNAENAERMLANAHIATTPVEIAKIKSGERQLNIEEARQLARYQEVQTVNNIKPALAARGVDFNDLTPEWKALFINLNQGISVQGVGPRVNLLVDARNSKHPVAHLMEGLKPYVKDSDGRKLMSNMVEGTFIHRYSVSAAEKVKQKDLEGAYPAPPPLPPTIPLQPLGKGLPPPEPTMGNMAVNIPLPPLPPPLPPLKKK